MSQSDTLAYLRTLKNISRGGYEVYRTHNDTSLVCISLCASRYNMYVLVSDIIEARDEVLVLIQERHSASDFFAESIAE